MRKLRASPLAETARGPRTPGASAFECTFLRRPRPPSRLELAAGALALLVGGSAAAATPAPAAEMAAKPTWIEKRHAELKDELDGLERASRIDHKALESACTRWQPAELYEHDPLLEGRLKLCAAKAALALGDDVRADERLRAAVALLEKQRARPGAEGLLAEAIFLEVEREAQTMKDDEECGETVGLEALVGHEKRRLQERQTKLLERYREILGVGTSPFAERALVGILEISLDLYEDTYLDVPKSFRARPVRRPFSFDASAPVNMTPDVAAARRRWETELALLIERATAEHAGDAGANARLGAARQRLAELRARADLPPAPPSASPVREALAPGDVRALGPDVFEMWSSSGRFEPVSADEGRRRIAEHLAAGPSSPSFGFALVAAADSGQPVEVATVAAALASENLVVNLAGLHVIETRPQQDHYEPLLTFFDGLGLPTKGPTAAAYEARFQTRERARFGREERALRAMAALVAKERDLTPKLSQTGRLPLDERTWLLAELGEQKLRWRYKEMAELGDDLAAANALYGFYRAMGDQALWSLKQTTRGRAGCVAKTLLDAHGR